MKLLADEFVKVYESADPSGIYCYSPGLALLPSGRLAATLDLGGPGVRQAHGKVFTSDDQGLTWTHRTDYPYVHARPFVVGHVLYVIGHNGDLTIMRSDDEGENWTDPVRLTRGEEWHQAPCNVHYANGSVYLVMEKRLYRSIESWPVGELAPILMRGRTDSDLTAAANWTFASELAFCDAVPVEKLDYFGVPFFHSNPQRYIDVAPNRGCAPAGWLETNVVQFVDQDHVWNDPAGKTFHLWMRAHTGGSGYAAIAKVVEDENGAMTTMLETVPSGKHVVFVPCPGGQMKFHILFDERTQLYWLLSTQATDSMTKADRLPPDRYNLPNNERTRLQLHFSRNCIDWCFAGLVAAGATAKQSRHYASMVIDGEDLHILSRSGDERSFSSHNGNFISFHTVKRFRELVY
ncbi:sialidase family protein [Paenibacillus sp. N3.4]|uniref:WD40/YVTN/BNR-like repeat-containing protein n=1 Tax=Paenibacillus sp. N3.4 TaxID=2603222 RepID=UPI0011C74A6E|nr:sialidase family protein [Paenibacillus sp. N3.4]TXK85315.1 exo-alpha-sialidase [Paenibacillus sp. N3.4]